MTPPAHLNGTGPVQGPRLRGWLLERLGLCLDRAPSAIDVTVPFDAYGMDSVAGLSLRGDLEERFGLETDATLLWDHPTAGSLLRHLESVLPSEPR